MRRMYSEEQVKKMIQNALSSGDMKDVKVFENIVDKDGHPRFLQGEINIKENIVFTKDYAKWTLSGTHLLIVICLSMKSGDVYNSGNVVNTIDLPDWIKNKIKVLFGSEVAYQNVIFFNDDLSTQNTACYLEKNSNTNIISVYLSGITASKDRACRIAFDILIDND